jgi:IS4 transposase
LVDLRWVFVHDRDGTHRDQYFYCTDPDLSPQEIITLYTSRWSIEVTFQEVREHLGFETTKQHSPKSVLRTGPCLLSCYSIVALIYAKIVEHRKPIIHNTPSYSKSEPAFSDALFVVRRRLWDETILKHAIPGAVVSKLPAQFMDFVLDQLSATG